LSLAKVMFCCNKAISLYSTYGRQYKDSFAYERVAPLSLECTQLLLVSVAGERNCAFQMTRVLGSS
jgi:hypothetical protein